jgi:hypothetical protein
LLREQPELRQEIVMRTFVALSFAVLAVAGCASQQNAEYCSARLSGSLTAAMDEARERLGNGCEYHFDGYYKDLLSIAEANPDSRNRMHFSDFLLQVNDMGVISRRQAEALYNRYFGIKFITMQGDYNTCSQTCPQRARVLSDMKAELHDKELGLLRASNDQQSFYRADNLLKETELVLEATCTACEAGARR